MSAILPGGRVGRPGRIRPPSRRCPAWPALHPMSRFGRAVPALRDEVRAAPTSPAAS